jgi:hypothetical protein
MTALTQSGDDFKDFTMLYLDEKGRFLDPRVVVRGKRRLVEATELPKFLERIWLPEGVTDTFVWVHGWRNNEARAVSTARKLFANLTHWFATKRALYPKLPVVVPGYVAVNWPSDSLPTPGGYKKIRDRAALMTTKGEAEFFLASLLGYLDRENVRGPTNKVLRTRRGFYLHCLGHSFGGRFLTAAIRAAATPTDRSRKLLAAAYRDTGLPFTVDSLCILQMAAPANAFGTEFSSLLAGPLSGPIVLTHSTADKALCTWHKRIEPELGIGCLGATAPQGLLGSISLRPADSPYADTDFSKDITNVDASRLFTEGGLEGGHSDFWHEETLHLIASVVEQTRR